MGCNCAMHGKPVGIGGMDDVADVHLAQADAPADRRGDVRIGKLQLGVVDRRLVGLNRAFELAYARRLRIELLLGDDFRFPQRLVTRQVCLRVFELSLDRAPSDLRPARAAPGTAVDRFRRAESPFLTNWPSWKLTAINWPSTRLFTTTELNGVTVPKPRKTTGMSPLRTGTAITGTARLAARLACAAAASCFFCCAACQ